MPVDTPSVFIRAAPVRVSVIKGWFAATSDDLWGLDRRRCYDPARFS